MSALPLRGGNWNDASRAGVFALNLNEPRANSNHDVGFRAAFLSGQIPGAQGLRVRAERQKGHISTPVRAAKNQTFMEAASNPESLRARAVTHEKLWNMVWYENDQAYQRTGHGL